MKAKQRKIPVKEAKDGANKKLQARIRKLEKENRQLISKLNTAERALRENMRFLKGTTEDCTLEDLIEAANNKKTLKEVKENQIDDPTKCPKCGNALLVAKILDFRIETCSCGYRKKESV